MVLLLASMVSLPAFAHSDATRNPAEHNLTREKVGLKGFDPVAVFPEGGGAPQAGKAEFKLDYEGVTYLFASDEHRERFLQDPAKYEPTYGGWCAYAMAQGSKVDIQPDLFTISGNRAHFFVSRRAKQSFDRDIADHELRADANWKRISGEDPRR